ncbi:MAG: M20 family metallopeptidase [Actinomycetes bacterium]
MSTTRMIDDLAALVEAESPSGSPTATRLAADRLDELLEAHTGRRAEWVGDERGHLLWSGGGRTRVLLLGHVDTVWPVGTRARWPFDVANGRATGPGCFDMKAGLVQGLAALSRLDDLTGVALLATTDEEIGSPTSRELVERTAAGCDAVLVLEPSAAGALKTARKGVALYEVVVTGRAAHAGLEPEAGANAAVEAAHQVLDIAALGDRSAGTTVTPTVLAAGTTTNTVPASARVAVDVRAVDAAEHARVDAALRALPAHVDGCTVEVVGGVNRPPLEAASSAALFARAQRLAAELGQPPLEGASVGGASDGNFTAGVGVPTLDGLGAVGGGAHAEGEHVVVDAMAPRSALVGALLRELLA